MPATYDLRPLADADRVGKTPRLVLVVGLLLAVGFEGTEVAWSMRGAEASSDLVVNAVVVAATGLFVGVGCWGLPRLFRGAAWIRIDDVGLHLRFERGYAVHLRWTDRAGFILRERRTAEGSHESRSDFTLRTPRFSSRQSPLTLDAFLAISTAAPRHGLTEDRTVVSRTSGGEERIAHRWRPTSPNADGFSQRDGAEAVPSSAPRWDMAK